MSKLSFSPNNSFDFVRFAHCEFAYAYSPSKISCAGFNGPFSDAAILLMSKMISSETIESCLYAGCVIMKSRKKRAPVGSLPWALAARKRR